MKRILIILALTLAQPAWSFDHQHGLFASTLDSVVSWNSDGTATAVDYRKLAQHPDMLLRYLETLSAVTPTQYSGWSRDEQLAFLINAYNAFTLQLILDHYPVDSIRDIGRFWQSPWEIEFFQLLGRDMHLDHLEHELIRDWSHFGEPRIHFAVNCASIGCPALQDEPFVAEKLEAQLEDSTRRFLRDESRNRFHDGRLEVSSIFDWYREDFEQGWRGAESLAEFLALYEEELGLNPASRQNLREGEISIRFLDYDWSLNEKK